MTTLCTKKFTAAACALVLAALTAGCMDRPKNAVLGFAGRRKAPEDAAARENPRTRGRAAEQNAENSALAARPGPMAAPALSPDEFRRRAPAQNDFERDYALSRSEQYSPVPEEYLEYGEYSAPENAYAYAPPAGDYGAYTASRGTDRLGGYDRPDSVRVPQPLDADERIPYDGIEANLPGMNLAQAPLPGTGPVAKPFAGAHVGRSNFSKPARSTKQPDPAGDDSRKPWENGNLFSENAPAVASARQAAPNIYASRFRDEGNGEMWPAGMAMVPPAAAPGSAALPRAEVRLPAPAARPAAPAPRPAAPAPAPAAHQDSGADDGVFSPSMFLGAAR
jgi:hypothetical protein